MTHSTHIDKYSRELEKCSKCGFCQAFCPTYAVTGRETMTARGRNVLLAAVIQGTLPLSEAEEAISTCLLCKACVPSCFTGVRTDELVRNFREIKVRTEGAGFVRKMVFEEILPRPALMALLLKAAVLFNRLGLTSLSNKLRKAGALMTPVSGRSLRKMRSTPGGKGKVAYFRSCGFTYLLPHTGESTMELLNRLGFEAVLAGSNCCGLPPYAHGATDAARELARRNIEALEGFDIIITECGSCSSQLKKYAELLGDDSSYAKRAKRFSERVVDCNEFILKQLLSAAVPNPPLIQGGGETRCKVTYHDPCHLSRFQGITREPREIIKSIPGVEFTEMREADWCCGGAGAYSIVNSELSEKILDRKIENIRRTGADVVVTSCPSCMIQLSYGVRRAGLNVKVMHVNELLSALMTDSTACTHSAGG